MVYRPFHIDVEAIQSIIYLQTPYISITTSISSYLCVVSNVYMSVYTSEY